MAAPNFATTVRGCHLQPEQSCLAASSAAAVRCCGSNTTSPELSERACLSICIVGAATNNRAATDAPCGEINGAAASLDEAREDCARRGRRLCTPAELSGQTCCHSGCQFDGVPVWSSASCSSPSLEHRHATVSPRSRRLVNPKHAASEWTLLGAECSRHGRPVRVRHASFKRKGSTGCSSAILPRPFSLDEMQPIVDSRRASLLALSQPLSAQQWASWSRLDARLRGHGTARVVAIGGSMASGVGCFEGGLHPRQCAYSSRWVDWLRSTFYGCLGQGRLEVINRAVGGTTTATAVPMLPYLLTVERRRAAPNGSQATTAADLLVVDYSCNDQFEAQGSERHKGARPGDEADASLATSPVAAATEGLLRYVMAQMPQTAVLFVDGTCVYKSRRRHTTVAAARARVAQAYGVPLVAYADMLQPGLARATPTGCPLSAAPRASEHEWGCHVGTGAHRLIAAALAQWYGAFAQRLRAGAHATVEPPQSPLSALHAKYKVCHQPVSHFSGDAIWQGSGHAAAGVRASGWALQEDRPGKAGWITTGPAGATLEFGIDFGAEPRLAVLYERGYEEFGDALVHLNSRPLAEDDRIKSADRRANILSGLREDGEHVTQADFALYNLDQWTPPLRHTRGNRLRLTLSRAGFKFKVRAVSTC